MVMTEILFRWITEHPEITLIGAVTIIQIAPIKINPWNAIAVWIRRLVTGDMEDKIDDISSKVSKLEAESDRREAMQARTHILRFADELYNGNKHSKEYFDEILSDIDRYEKYCYDNPMFANNKTVMATQTIRDTYDTLFKAKKFL